MERLNSIQTTWIMNWRAKTQFEIEFLIPHFFQGKVLLWLAFLLSWNKVELSETPYVGEDLVGGQGGEGYGSPLGYWIRVGKDAW